MNNRHALISIFVSIGLAALVAWAGSQNGQSFRGIPTYAFCVGVAFLINWLAFIPANLLKTEKFYDLTGSITYVTVTLIALTHIRDADNRSYLLAGLVILWAIRLGTFLFRRVLRDGGDDRFDKIKPVFIRFFNVWTLQALWVSLTASAALIAITSTNRKELGIFAIVGTIVWIVGFVFEVVADYQKSQFKKDPANKGQFINTGLWAKSRHPNYFGEIVLWIGIFIIAIPVLQGWQWIAILSPLFVIVLLTKISGIPGLEAKANKRWGGQPDYEAYKANTPVLIPKL